MPVDGVMQEENRAQEMGRNIRMLRPQREAWEGKVKVLMWGYLPTSSPQRAPMFHPTTAPPPLDEQDWKAVCSGGCGFAMAISASGKVHTWGSTGDLGESYVTAEKHEGWPEPFHLPSNSPVAQAAAGWAHCVVATDSGEVYMWGWKECVPTNKFNADTIPRVLRIGSDKDLFDAQGKEQDGGKERPLLRPVPLTEHLDFLDSTHTASISTTLKSESSVILKGDDGNKKRKLAMELPTSSDISTVVNDEDVWAPPCLVTLHSGVHIVSVAAGGRHTLALSDIGEVWGWGYGGEGQLGLGSRISTISSPQPVPCFDCGSLCQQDVHTGARKGKILVDEKLLSKTPGTYITAVACGGRHSAVLTDAGALLTFGWGLYGQCGQGCTDDEVSPCYVSSLGGLPIKGVAAGLWHTVCITDFGDVYSFGGNQFGQLGTGGDQAELYPLLLEAPVLEGVRATSVSCGARHSAICTDAGKVFCWGWNKYGQLGAGDGLDRNSPVETVLEGSFARDVVCGWWHTLALVRAS